MGGKSYGLIKVKPFRKLLSSLKINEFKKFINRPNL